MNRHNIIQTTTYLVFCQFSTATILLSPFNVDALQGQDSNVANMPVALTRAHSHNDYLQKRPLKDALENGFCSVEADVFLHKDELHIAHTYIEITKNKTLTDMYLNPLKQRIDENGGQVFPDTKQFYLFIDFKTKASATLKKLDEQLVPYQSILSRFENGRVTKGAVTIVISGNRPVKEIATAKKRYVFLDGRLGDSSAIGADIAPVISESWNTHFKYRGFRDMNDTESAKLKSIVEKIHSQGKLLRFWALPDREGAWSVAFDSKVDLINTDKLAELKTFLVKKSKTK